MSLIENTLFGIVNKIEIAIARIKAYEPPEGYYLAFSGGKDSCTILQLARMANVKYDAHYNATTIDPPELFRFVKYRHPEVSIDVPPKSFFKVMLDQGIAGMPPTRKIRWCCQEFKEKYGTGRLLLTGIRWAESNKRKKRNMYEVCNKDHTKFYLHPIIDWEEEDVWEFIRLRNLPYCSLYDEGYNRIGCIMCPQSGIKQKLRDAKRWPQNVRQMKRAMTIILKNHPGHTWKNADEYFNWWINEPEMPDERQECLIFEDQ